MMNTKEPKQHSESSATIAPCREPAHAMVRPDGRRLAGQELQSDGELWRVYCRGCSQRGPWKMGQEAAILAWNEMNLTKEERKLRKDELVRKLKDGKAKMAERCLAVAKAIAEEAGVESFEYLRGLRGRAYPKAKRIQAPEPTTRRRLYIWAHECAHVALEHGKGEATHRKEYEAEQWAHAALRRHGIPVPRRATNRAREYVAMKIRRAERRGAKHIDPQARTWSKKK